MRKATGKPFQKNDERINRRGRAKKGESLTCLLNKKLDEKDKKTGKLNRQLVAEKLYDLAMSGNEVCLRYLVDRIDGKCRETLNANVSGNIIDPTAIVKKLEKALLDK